MDKSVLLRVVIVSLLVITLFSLLPAVVPPSVFAEAVDEATVTQDIHQVFPTRSLDAGQLVEAMSLTNASPSSDSVYQWHTFYGGDANDGDDKIALDSNGNILTVGYHASDWRGPDGQLPLGAFSGEASVCVTKLSASGQYQWHTFFGDSYHDVGTDIVTDKYGNVYVSGFSFESWTGPAGQLPLHAHSGGADGYVIKLSPTGVYEWHTFYGEYHGDDNLAIAIDSNDDLYLTGHSGESWTGPAGQLPLNAFDENGSMHVLKLSSDGAYEWHTFYGGSAGDFGDAIALDESGAIYVAGHSSASWNGPAGETPLHTYSGSDDMYVLKLDVDGGYQWHAFYGSVTHQDLSSAIVLSSSGNIYVTGYGNASWNGPDGQLPLNVFSGEWEAYILKLAPSGAYQWHTFYGGTSDDYGYDLVPGEDDSVYVTGLSAAAWNGPVGQIPLNLYSEDSDVYIVKLDTAGIYQWHTFFGGTKGDEGSGIAIDKFGSLYISGYSDTSWNGPNGQAPLNPYSGSFDALVLKLGYLDLPPVVYTPLVLNN